MYLPWCTPPYYTLRVHHRHHTVWHGTQHATRHLPSVREAAVTRRVAEVTVSDTAVTVGARKRAWNHSLKQGSLTGPGLPRGDPEVHGSPRAAFLTFFTFAQNGHFVTFRHSCTSGKPGPGSHTGGERGSDQNRELNAEGQESGFWD